MPGTGLLRSAPLLQWNREQASLSPPLCFVFLICKMGTVIVSDSSGSCEDCIQSTNKHLLVLLLLLLSLHLFRPELRKHPDHIANVTLSFIPNCIVPYYFLGPPRRSLISLKTERQQGLSCMPTVPGKAEMSQSPGSQGVHSPGEGDQPVITIPTPRSVEVQ